MQYLSVAGVNIPDQPKIITPNIREAITTGKFEAEEASELPAIVKDGDRVLEIGAGIGFISTLLDRQRAVEHVVAVEANPTLLPFMEVLHSANQVTKVTRKNAVLTNEQIKSMTFYVRNDFWMGSLAAEPNPFITTVEVPTENFNQLIRTEKITIIVCDIEGAERFLFKDADLTGVDRVFLELHDHITGLNGVREVFSSLDAHGFAYDPRHSKNSVVLFRRLEENEVLRPYAG